VNPPIQYRPLTVAEQQRRSRAGRADPSRNLVGVPVETRNGLPLFRPYRYRAKEATRD